MIDAPEVTVQLRRIVSRAGVDLCLFPSTS